jgi:Bacterial Ig-like domain (group 2)
VDFADTLKNLGLDQMSGEGNLLFPFTGRAGDLVLWTGSVDQSANFVFPVEPEGVGKSLGKASGYWTVANGFDTMYTVFNPTDKSEDVVATFHNGDGSDGYELPIHLEAQASTTLDLMNLIEAARPDAHGKVIPKTMPNGGIVFESAEGRAKWMTLVVSGGIYNAHRATCTRTCISCYGYSYFQVSPSSFSVTVNGTKDLSAYTVYFDGSLWYCGINVVCAWSSSNTAVATVNSAGTVTGQAAGSVSITAQFPPMVMYTGQICSTTGQPTCPQASPAPAATGTVCDFSIRPGSFSALCDGQIEVVDYTAVNSSSSCTACQNGSSCSATKTGNVDISRTTFTIDATGQGKCEVEFFAGPPQQDGNAGTITPSFTIAFCGTEYSKSRSLSTEIGCPGN